MTKLAEAIANTVKAGQDRLGKVRYKTYREGIAENGIGALSKIFGG